MKTNCGFHFIYRPCLYDDNFGISFFTLRRGRGGKGGNGLEIGLCEVGRGGKGGKGAGADGLEMG
jgi:hypothetical protein